MKNKANIFLFTACLFTFGLIAYNMLTYEKNQIEFKEIEEVIRKNESRQSIPKTLFLLMMKMLFI